MALWIAEQLWIVSSWKWKSCTVPASFRSLKSLKTGTNYRPDLSWNRDLSFKTLREQFCFFCFHWQPLSDGGLIIVGWCRAVHLIPAWIRKIDAFIFKRLQILKAFHEGCPQLGESCAENAKSWNQVMVLKIKTNWQGSEIWQVWNHKTEALLAEFLG